jgi:hypothetical protein
VVDCATFFRRKPCFISKTAFSTGSGMLFQAKTAPIPIRDRRIFQVLRRANKKKPLGMTQGFFLELEFKVFVRTVNQAGFSGIFGRFRDIGALKLSHPELAA